MSTLNKPFGELLGVREEQTLKNTPNIVSKEAALPVKGGRQTVPDGVYSLAGFLAELATVTPDFNLKLLGALEMLSIYNGEISMAVENIVTLGNTVGSFPTNISFDDSVSDVQAKEMIQRLKVNSKTWYTGGINSLTNDLLSQIAVNGSLSAEMVATNSLDGIRKVVKVSPKTVKFRYDTDEEDYMPYQYSTNITSANAVNGIKLNTNTYKYHAIRRVGEKPYGIPPFISALENIQISKDMGENLKHVVKKLGILGFLEVLVSGPKPKAGESDKDYYRRTSQYISAVAPEIEKGLDKGYVVGFKDNHEFKLQPTTGNVQGAKDLIEINDVKLFAGLKQDPLMFGRNFSTTETLARVILAKMTTQITNYQYIVKTFLEMVFLADLQLGGYAIQNIEIEFDAPMIGDQQRVEETRAKKIANLKEEYSQGIISQETLAIELGREKPDQDEPRQLDRSLDEDGSPKAPKDPEAKEDVTKTKDKKDKKENSKMLPWQHAMLNYSTGYKVVDLEMTNGDLIENVVTLNGEFLATFNVHKVVSIQILENVSLGDVTQTYSLALGGACPEYQYSSEGCNCDSVSFDKDDDDLSKFINQYLAATGVVYDKAVNKAIREIGRNLSKLSDGASQSTVYDTIMYTLYKNWGQNFTQPQKSVVNKFVKNVYTFFRKDKSIFKGASDIPKGTFSSLDLRAIEYYKRTNNLYLGKFITDKDLKKRITQYLKDEYLEGDLPIGTNAEALKKFKNQFGDVMKGQEWKLSRVINTTVNKMRNTAAVSYMQEAEIEKFEIVGVNDRLQCPYCASLQGMSFSVGKAVSRLKDTVVSDPELINVDTPFINSVYKKPEDLKGVSAEVLQNNGIGVPPFHANCRDQIVAIL